VQGCVFQRPTEADILDVEGLYTNPVVRRYLGGPIPASEAKRRVRLAMLLWVKEGLGPWVVRETGSGMVVGYGGLSWYEGGPRVEVSYQVFPEWWGRGFGFGIIEHSVADGFERLGLDDIWAETQAANQASRKLLRRAGFQFVEEVERYGALQEVLVLHRSSPPS
jgi:ribosomal-protein-alanine N-acetyltransferase